MTLKKKGGATSKAAQGAQQHAPKKVINKTLNSYQRQKQQYDRLKAAFITQEEQLHLAQQDAAHWHDQLQACPTPQQLEERSAADRRAGGQAYKQHNQRRFQAIFDQLSEWEKDLRRREGAASFHSPFHHRPVFSGPPLHLLNSVAALPDPLF